jgi:uncharacterized membrane protein YdjX (TVP38/TMEM64 family)
MKSALRTVLGLLAVFASSALVLAFFVDVDAENVGRWLMATKETPVVVFCAVIAVLAVDAVLAVPTNATIVVAGHLLGPLWGGLGSFIGVMLAGSICYWGGRLVGPGRWVKAHAIDELRRSVGTIGPTPLLLGRASPMLPELLSALAGMGRMSARQYYLYFALGNLPFALLVAYAGSVSTVERPWPAIAAGIVLPALLAVVAVLRRRARGRRARARTAFQSQSS